MNELLDELTETFERSSAVFDELLETAKTKQRCLITGNIEGLETLLYQEKNQAEIAQLLEEKRQNLLSRYSKEYNMREKNITVKALMNKMDHLDREKIGSLLDKLTQSIKQLQEVNQVNTTLTHYSLEITEDIMKIFCPPAFQYPIYRHNGEILENVLSRVLIDTEI